jgi:hypothetical protein
MIVAVGTLWILIVPAALSQMQVIPDRDESSGTIDDPVSRGREPGEADPQDDPKADPARKPNASGQGEAKRGEWIAAPIPISNPAIGSGLEWVAAYLFKFHKDDKVSPDSIIGTGGLFTNNGSWGVAVAAKLYLKEDRYRLTAGGGTAGINADIYGVGKWAGDRGLFLPLTVDGSAFVTEALFRIGKDLYIGPRFQYRNLTLAINQEEVDIPDIDNPPEHLQEIVDEIRASLLHQQTVGVGPRIQLDTRDNTFYPRKGFFLDSGIDLFTEALGSRYSYQYYKLAFNKYTSLGNRQVLAFRGMGCAAAGDHVPIYDLCLFGSSNDVRGYSAGRYQDRRMFATQAEYRLNLPLSGFFGRFGVVAFGGFGGIGAKFSDIGFSDLLPGGGGGLRFRLTKQNPINFRIDYGIGKVGHTLTIGVAEAF